MNKAINLSPEALELVNQLCDPLSLDDKIRALETAEDRLQQAAYEKEAEDGFVLYDVAYTIKIYRKELTKLKTLIENVEEED